MQNSSVEVSPGVKLFVRDWGKGRPLLFIHGWPLSEEMFEYQFTQLPQQGYRCIGLDLRGYGRSDQPWNDCTYDTFADDIKKVIDTLKLEDVVLIGFSVGGAIVLRYMEKYKEHKVTQLVLIGAAAPSFTKRPGYPYGYEKSEIDDWIKASYADRPQLVADFGKKFFYQKVSQSLVDWFHHMGMEASPQTIAQTLVSLRDSDVSSALAALTVPTFIFHAIHDKICPFAFAEVMHKSIKGSHLIPFENSSHGLVYEERDTFNQELIKSIKSSRS